MSDADDNVEHFLRLYELQLSELENLRQRMSIDYETTGKPIEDKQNTVIQTMNSRHRHAINHIELSIKFMEDALESAKQLAEIVRGLSR